MKSKRLGRLEDKLTLDEALQFKDDFTLADSVWINYDRTKLKFDLPRTGQVIRILKAGVN